MTTSVAWTSGGIVTSVGLSGGHAFSKAPCASIRLLTGLGVEGDAHCGATVKHRSRVAADPAQPNLRQIHLVHAELFDELAKQGYRVGPGDLGENITTSGLDLLALPAGTAVHIGRDAVILITGLRNPCLQIERFQKGLLAAVLDKGADGQPIRKAGIMGIVRSGGMIKPGDVMRVRLPPGPRQALEPV